jgi:hypothetical protein
MTVPSHFSTCALAVCFFACDPPRAEVNADPPPPPASATVSPSTSASGSAAASIPAAPSRLGLVEQKHLALDGPGVFYPVEGALLVSSQNRIGRLSTSGIEWLGRVQTLSPLGVGISVASVSGRYPDAIDVVYQTELARAPMPTYAPLTGKGTGAVFSNGGGMGWISGVARVGDSVLVAGFTHPGGGHVVAHGRGPEIERPRTTLAEAGCTPEEVQPDRWTALAVEPESYGATRAGTIISLGKLCRKRGPVAEIWDAAGGKSRIVKLDEWVKDVDSLMDLVPGKGDVAWFPRLEDERILEYRNGTFSLLPPLPNKRQGLFVSDDGTLHATDGAALFRYEGGAWTTIATFVWTPTYANFALWDGILWATTAGRVFKLEPSPSIEHSEACTTPFVHLYDVSYLAEPTYTFPTTRKALATFDRLDEIGLVEFYEGRRRLGVTVPSKDVGEAVIAHVAKTMTDEKPKLLCYAPKETRSIPVAKAK